VKRSSRGSAAARLDEIAVRWSLDREARGRLGVLLELVRDDPRAATSVRDPVEAAYVHVADSLTALPVLDRRDRAGPVADVGSGAGFPGLPLAIARPALQVDLVESATRKTAFLESAVAALGLRCVGVVDRRAEEWASAGGAQRYGTVLARAVDALPALLEYAAPLLGPGGMLIAWKGALEQAEQDAARSAGQELGMAPAGTERTTPYPGSRSHTLHLYEKVRPTPERFPRRAGMARKRPVG
jgi:16S rRNA (guanine527-N7)-methyltransferase